MNKPQSVTLLGFPYAIEWVENLEDEGTKLDGHILYNDFKIRVNSQVNEKGQQVTFLHEVFHGICRMTGAFTIIDNEGFMEAMAYAVLGMLKNNPEVVKYLLEEPKDA